MGWLVAGDCIESPHHGCRSPRPELYCNCYIRTCLTPSSHRNYCGRPDGCSFAGSSTSPFPLRLSHRQCQLRYSFLSNITFGSPLIVAVSGGLMPCR